MTSTWLVRKPKNRWKYLFFIALSTLAVLTYVIIYSRSTFSGLQCTSNTHARSNSFRLEKILWHNKTLILRGKLTFRCNSSEIVIRREVLEEAEIFKEQQKKVKNIPERDVVNINCSALIAVNDVIIKEIEELMAKVKRPPIPDSYYVTATKDCDVFRLKHGYFLDSMTSEEENFPIAYSILLFKDVTQVERLLRAIYRPQNYYCIHVDKQTSASTSAAVRGIANCFSNVFVTSRSVDVRWGSFTVLEPELICMQELWKYRKWKYFINLTGQEFPLKTNLEIVRILKAYNGANDTDDSNKRNNTESHKGVNTAPHTIHVERGTVHIVASRGCVDNFLHSHTSRDLLKWIQETDESSRDTNWTHLSCGGKYSKQVCVFGVRDLHLLVKARQLFANKFHQSYQPFAFDCIEEWHYNRTRDEYLGVTNFNTNFYKQWFSSQPRSV